MSDAALAPSSFMPAKATRHIADTLKLQGPDLHAAILPASRSGRVGGDALTVFTTILNAGDGSATGCTLGLQDDAPVSLGYRAVDGTNTAIGPESPVFDIPANGQQSFVLALTPQRLTTGRGEDVRVLFSCAGAAAPSIVGVNSVFLTISNSAVPDIIAIGATPSGDGSLRISDHNGRQAMSAAAVNIGETADMLVVLRTGGGELPASFSICQSDSSGICASPRSTHVNVNMAGSPVFFSILALDEDGDRSSIPDDPANARLYLVFVDSGGDIRGMTSVGVASGPALDLDPAADTRPIGRWISLLSDAASPDVYERGDMFSLPSGSALLSTRQAIIRFETDAGSFNVRRRNFDGLFTRYTATTVTSGTGEGYWFPRRVIRATFTEANTTTSTLSGVYDERSFEFDGIDEFGPYTHLMGSWTLGSAATGTGISDWTGTITITQNGGVSGTLDGCTVTGSLPNADFDARGVQPVSLTLSSCDRAEGSGVGEGVIYIAIEGLATPRRYLLVTWDNGAVRTRMVHQE